jgi:hypothetical protein
MLWKQTQRSSGVSPLTLFSAAVQELIAIDRDYFNLFEAGKISMYSRFYLI